MGYTPSAGFEYVEKKMKKKILANELKQARSAHGTGDMSLRELSALTDIAPSTISDYENGRRYPSVGNLFTLARVLGIDLNEVARRYLAYSPDEKDEKAASAPEETPKIDEDNGPTSPLEAILEKIRDRNRGVFESYCKAVGEGEE